MGDTDKFFSTASSFLKEASPYIAAGATLAGAALPLFIQQDEIASSALQPTTAQEIESELVATANQKANQRRREIAKRRGQQSTIKTGLGVSTDFGVKQQGITGV